MGKSNELIEWLYLLNDNKLRTYGIQSNKISQNKYENMEVKLLNQIKDRSN